MPQQKRSLERWATLSMAALVLVLGIRHTAGPVPSFDTIRYANVGHWISGGKGVSASVTVVPVQEGTADRGEGLHAFTIQPPALSWFYAATGVERRGTSHRLLNLVSFLGLALAAWLMARRLIDDPAAASLVAVLTASAPVALESAASMWTDLPFAALMAGAVFCLVRSHDESRSLWWLAGAAALAGLAVTFRYPGLGLGLMFVVDAALAWRRAGIRRALLRLTLGLGIFAVAAVPLLVRNMMLAGSWTGSAPRDFAMAPGFDLTRGWSFVGSRLLQVFAPGFWSQTANEFVVTANRAVAGWWLPKVLGPALVAGAVALGVWRRRAGRGSAVSDDVVTLVAAALGYLVVVWGGAANHDEIHVVEFRYALPLAPFLFLGLAALLRGSLRGKVFPVVAGVLIVTFLVGSAFQPRPKPADHAFLQEGLDWLAANVPVEDGILTNGGKVLLEEDLSRRIHHLSIWHYKHALPEASRSGAGLFRFMKDRDIRWVVMIGKPDRRMVAYWGRGLTSLFTGNVWTDQLAHRSEGMLVYRVPQTMAPSGGGR